MTSARSGMRILAIAAAGMLVSSSPAFAQVQPNAGGGSCYLPDVCGYCYSEYNGEIGSWQHQFTLSSRTCHYCDCHYLGYALDFCWNWHGFCPMAPESIAGVAVLAALEGDIARLTDPLVQAVSVNTTSELGSAVFEDCRHTRSFAVDLPVNLIKASVEQGTPLTALDEGQREPAVVWWMLM